MTAAVPDELDPRIQTHEIGFEADVSLATPFLKLAGVTVQTMRMKVLSRY